MKTEMGCEGINCVTFILGVIIDAPLLDLALKSQIYVTKEGFVEAIKSGLDSRFEKNVSIMPCY